jgi:hypothetical protein
MDLEQHDKAPPLRLLEGIGLVLLIVWIMATGTELVGRHQLRTKLESDYKQLTEAAFRQDEATSAVTLASDITNIAKVRRTRERLELLMTNGAQNPRQTQSAIRASLEPDPTPGSTQSHSVSSKDADSWKYGLANAFCPVWMDNFTLLAALAISSGALGAMIFGLRHGRTVSMRQFFVGAATGVICFLIFAGGSAVSGKLSSSESHEWGPVPCALVSLFAGLFSTKAFELFSDLFIKIIDHIRQAFGVHGEG